MKQVVPELLTRPWSRPPVDGRRLHGSATLTFADQASCCEQAVEN